MGIARGGSGGTNFPNPSGGSGQRVARARWLCVVPPSVYLLCAATTARADACCGYETVEANQTTVAPGDVIRLVVRWRGDPDIYGHCKGAGARLLTGLTPEEAVSQSFRPYVGVGSCNLSCMEPTAFSLKVPESLDPVQTPTLWLKAGLIYPCGSPTCPGTWCWYCSETQVIQVVPSPGPGDGGVPGRSGTTRRAGTAAKEDVALCDADCNDNGTPDIEEICGDPSVDCNANGVLDACESLDDVDGNGVPDECEQGACCDSGGGETCREGVTKGECDGRWLAGAACDPDPFVPECGPYACCIPDDPVDPVVITCQGLPQDECTAAEGVWEPGLFCGHGEYGCNFWACANGEGTCTLPAQAYCDGGGNVGEPCDPYSLPSDCPDGECVGRVGCEDPCCCTEVCRLPETSYCCHDHWDEYCARTALFLCDMPPINDECWADDEEDGAIPVSVPGSAPAGVLHATENATDFGLCCYGGEVGAKGVGTVWYKFVAPPPSDPQDLFPSVELDACCGATSSEASANDSLIQVYSIDEPDRGICDDGSECSIAAPECADGSDCVLDEQRACMGLTPLACGDDAGNTCTCGTGIVRPNNAKLCLPGLTPGQTYYVMVAAKTDENRGVYEFKATAPCTPRPPSAPGEMNGDGQVDLTDHMTFASCLNGPYVLGFRPQPLYPAPCCAAADADADGDVDLVDVAAFQRVFTGP